MCSKRGSLIAPKCGNFLCQKKAIHEECLEDYLFLKIKEGYYKGPQVKQRIQCPICRCRTIQLDYNEEKKILERSKEKDRALVSFNFLYNSILKS